MEDDIPKRIDGVIDAIDLLEHKNEAYRSSVLASLKGLDEELEKAVHRLAETQNKEPQNFIESLAESLLSKKPLSTIEQSNKKFYKYISKLGKRIEALKRLNDVYLNVYNSDLDKKALNEAISHYIFFFAAENSQNILDINFKQLCLELGISDYEELEKKFEGLLEVKAIQEDIAKKKLEGLKNWVFVNLPKLKELQSPLPLMTYEFYIVSKIERKKLGFKPAIALAKELFEDIYESHKAAIDKFMTFLVLWNVYDEYEYDDAEPRGLDSEPNTQQAPAHTNFTVQPSNSSFFDLRRQPSKGLLEEPVVAELPRLGGPLAGGSHGKSQLSPGNFFHRNYYQYLSQDLASLGSLFIQEANKVLKVAQTDPLLDVFKAGIITYPQFLQYVDLLNSAVREDEFLGITLELGEEYNYHTQIVCPVSKEVCSKDNPPVVLTCGHIISEMSAKKLAQIRSNLSEAKKFKCPVCPEEQTYARVRVVKID